MTRIIEVVRRGRQGRPGAVNTVAKYEALAVNTTLLNADYGSAYRATAAITITLPAAVDSAWTAIIDADGGAVTLSANGNINGSAADFVIGQNFSAFVYSDGTNYYVRFYSKDAAELAAEIALASGFADSSEAFSLVSQGWANTAEAAAIAAGASAGFDLSGRGGYIFRAKPDETGTEFVPESTVGTVPTGGIIMWSGSIASIPSGWALCDGASGTPDLRNRFIVGAGSDYTPGQTGGANSVTLTEAQMPTHAHYFNQNTNAAGNHAHTSSDGGGFLTAAGGEFNYGSGSAVFTGIRNTNTTGSHAHNVQGPTDNRGSGVAHENRPPYYALAYIMKL